MAGTVVTAAVNNINIVNGTASLDVAAGAAVDVNANITVEAASAINQDVTSDASPTFVTAKLSGLTDDYIPYHVDDTTGLANGPTKTNVDSAVSLKHTQGTDTTLGAMTDAIDTAYATVASHATTSAIWAAAGNVINFTGAETITDLPAAPQAGAQRTLICAGACIWTHAGNLTVQGAANRTCVAGDVVIVTAITTTTFRINFIAQTETGTGSTVRATNAVLVGPALGTPSSGNLVNCTGAQPSIYGTGVDGALTDRDTDSNATTITQTNATTPADNVILRATGNVAINNTITVGKQTGQARGQYPATWGSPGIPLGSIMSALGSKGISQPMAPGGGTASMNGGRLQILSGGTVDVSGAISSLGTNAASEGGGGGGLIVIIAKTSITGASAIDVSGGAGHATASAKGGSGSYSGEPGGHAGIGGSGGGAGARDATNATGGAGIKAGNQGGASVDSGNPGGGGGGSLDNAGSPESGGNGGNGGAGNGILSSSLPAPTMLLPGAARTLASASANGENGISTGGTGGSNGGGGGGGGYANDGSTPAGGAAQSTNPVGSGGGGGGADFGAGNIGGAGGNGSAGSTFLYALSSPSLYAGLPGGQGGGGGGGGGRGNTAGGAGGSGGAGAAGKQASDFHSGSNTGAGAGGVGAAGATGTAGTTVAGGPGGAGGAGGNGGGAAGLVVLISPSITYNGIVTGRLVQITGTDALNFIRGYDTR